MPHEISWNHLFLFVYKVITNNNGSAELKTAAIATANND